jgi:hypothetical protein
LTISQSGAIGNVPGLEQPRHLAKSNLQHSTS